MFLVSMACRVHVLEVDGVLVPSVDCDLNLAIMPKGVSLVFLVSSFDLVVILLIIFLPHGLFPGALFVVSMFILFPSSIPI